MPKTAMLNSWWNRLYPNFRLSPLLWLFLGMKCIPWWGSPPEYSVIMRMFGVGPALGPQLMAEIGDVCLFNPKKALVAFAGIDTPPYQSGQMEVHSRSISKSGSSALRRTLFLMMSVFLQRSPADEPVYQFMDKKRAEGNGVLVFANGKTGFDHITPISL